MFYIVNFAAILLLSEICICEKESVCVYFVVDVRVIGISEKSIYDQHMPNTSTGSNQFHTRDFNPCRFIIQKWDANKCALGIQESWKAADREGCPPD